MRRNQFSTEFQFAVTLRVFLDDLNTLASVGKCPVFVFAVREVVAQGGHTLRVRSAGFIDQVAGQVHVVNAHFHHGAHVTEADGFQQVELGAFFQELGCETSERAEEQGRLTVDDTGIQVRNRHRRCTNGGFTVDLGVMFLNDLRVFTDEPHT